jgi:hypothetical protein
VRVHDLRHTTASLWLAAGADPRVVQRVLRNATAAMTMDPYGHLVDARLWQAAGLIGGRTRRARRNRNPECNGGRRPAPGKRKKTETGRVRLWAFGCACDAGAVMPRLMVDEGVSADP